MKYNIRLHNTRRIKEEDINKTFNQFLAHITIDDKDIEAEFINYTPSGSRSWTNSANPNDYYDLDIANYYEFSIDIDEQTYEKVWKYLVNLDKSSKFEFGALECKETKDEYFGSLFQNADSYHSFN